jgi:hypothetical protein
MQRTHKEQSRMSRNRLGMFSLSAALVLVFAGCSKAPVEKAAPAASSQAPVVVVTAPPVVVAPAAEVKPIESAAKPAPVAKAKAKSAGRALSVKKLVVATGVERGSREPLGVAESFKQGEFEKIVAYVELENPGDESEVQVSFDPPSDAPTKGNVWLDVGTSPRWRTWASTKGVAEKGEWTAVVKTRDGRELARESFVVL